MYDKHDESCSSSLPNWSKPAIKNIQFPIPTSCNNQHLIELYAGLFELFS